MAPKVPDSYLQARREQIIESACSVFVEKGLDRTTMPDIFEAAGLSPGAVYNYFSGKEDIIEACIEKSLERNMAMISKAVASGGNPLLNIADNLFITLKMPGISKAIGFDLDLYAESTWNPRIAKLLKIIYDPLLEQLEKIVRQQQDEGGLNPALDSKALARFFIGLYFGLMVNIVIDPETDVDKAIVINKAVINGTFNGDNNPQEKESDE